MEDTSYAPIYRDSDEFAMIQKLVGAREIHFIEKCVNPLTKERYDKCELEEDSRWFFHGTKVHAQESIIDGGLKKSYNVVSAFGKGNYVSTLFSTSLGYTAESYGYRCLFLVKVKLGKININYTGNGHDIFCLKEDCQSLPIYRIGV